MGSRDTGNAVGPLQRVPLPRLRLTIDLHAAKSHYTSIPGWVKQTTTWLRQCLFRTALTPTGDVSQRPQSQFLLTVGQCHYALTASVHTERYTHCLPVAIAFCMLSIRGVAK